MEKIIYLQFFASRVEAEARINDIPVAKSHLGEQKTAGIPVRQYINEGINRIELRAQPNGQALSDSAELELRLAVFQEGEPLKFHAGREFARLRPVLNPLTPVPFSVFADASVDKGSGGNWAWAQAPVLDMARFRGALDNYVSRLAQLFAARDWQGLAQETKSRMTEDATAYAGVPLEARLADLRQLFTLGKDEQWRPLPVDPQKMIYRIAAGGRLVELLGADGLPALRTWCADILRPYKTPGYCQFPALVGVLKDRFAVLR